MHSDELIRKSKINRAQNKQTSIPSVTTPEHAVLRLQRVIGNAATQRLIQRADGDDDSEVESANENTGATPTLGTMERVYENLKECLADERYNDAVQWIHMLKRYQLDPSAKNLSAGAVIEGAFHNLFSKGGSLLKFGLVMKVEKLRKKVFKLAQDYEAVPGAYELFYETDFLAREQMTRNPFEEARQQRRENRTAANNREGRGNMNYRERRRN